MSEIKLLHGDSYKLIKDIPDKSVDLVYIDVPYLITNMSMGGGLIKEHNREKLLRELEDITHGINWSILDDITRVLKHIYIYMV